MKNKGELRVLVVGAGFMGSLHARSLQSSRLGRLCGLVDTNEEVARGIGDELAVPSYPELRQALDDTQPDVAIIATPDSEHRKPTEAVLEAGLHVLVEKPLATTVTDAQAMVERAERSKGRLMTGHLARFLPRYALAVEAIQAGSLGRPVMVTAATFGLTSLGARVGSTTNPLWHLAIHDIDAMQWLSGGLVADVYGAQFIESASGVSVFAATGSLTTGASFHLSAGWTLPGEVSPRRVFAVHCEHGVAEATWGTDGLTITKALGIAEVDCFNWPILHSNVEGALRLQNEHFLSALIDDAPFVITPEEAVAAVRSASALDQAAVRRTL